LYESGLYSRLGAFSFYQGSLVKVDIYHPAKHNSAIKNDILMKIQFYFSKTMALPLSLFRQIKCFSKKLLQRNK
jgi:hypothetical protein